MFDYRKAILLRMAERDMTQFELALLSGVSERTINQVLGGKTIPNMATIEDLLNTLGLELTVRDIE